MDVFSDIDPKDLILLLESEPTELFGRIVQLNRTPRYHNRLDVLKLASWVTEVKEDPSRIVIPLT